MRLTLLEHIGKIYNLDANELAVCSAIFSFTKGGRGWFSSYPILANQLPFTISEATVKRVVKRLIDLKLIERRGKPLFVTDLCINAETNCTSDKVNLAPEQGQTAPQVGSNCTQNKVKLPHIYNKDINNDNNKINLACDNIAQQETSSDEFDFDVFKSTFNKATDNHAEWQTRENACIARWKNMPQERRAIIIRWLKLNHPEQTNPIFFLDNSSSLEPYNYFGKEQPKGIDYFIAIYNGSKGLYSAADVYIFDMKDPIRFDVPN